MGQRQAAGTVLAGSCALVLAMFLSACTPPSKGTVVNASRDDRASFGSVKIPGKALRAPDAIAVAGNRVWVANSRYLADGGGGWITELSAKTGALIRVISARRDKLTDPEAVAVAGNRVWVVNSFGNSVTELNASTGALVRVISAQRYQLSDPGAIATDGNSVWVASNGSDSVTEINASTGALIRVISGRRYQFNDPIEIAASGDRVWVVSIGGASGGSVTEINAETCALMRVIPSLPNVAFAITTAGAGVWLVTNVGVKAADGAGPHGSVTELSAASGSLIRNIARPPFQASSPGGAIAADGTHIWVAETDYYSAGGWVAELSALSGALVRVISG